MHHLADEDVSKHVGTAGQISLVPRNGKPIPSVRRVGRDSHGVDPTNGGAERATAPQDKRVLPRALAQRAQSKLKGLGARARGVMATGEPRRHVEKIEFQEFEAEVLAEVLYRIAYVRPTGLHIYIYTYIYIHIYIYI